MPKLTNNNDNDQSIGFLFQYILLVKRTTLKTAD